VTDRPGLPPGRRWLRWLMLAVLIVLVLVLYPQLMDFGAELYRTFS